MDQNNNQPPKHVQVENAKKPERTYIVVSGKDVNDQQKVLLYFKSLHEAFMQTVIAKSEGRPYIKVYKEIELKLTTS